MHWPHLLWHKGGVQVTISTWAGLARAEGGGHGKEGPGTRRPHKSFHSDVVVHVMCKVGIAVPLKHCHICIPGSACMERSLTCVWLLEGRIFESLLYYKPLLPRCGV